MVKESNSIQEIFNRIAPVYDQLNDGLSLGQHRIWKKMALGWSGAKPGDTALDLCCGSGDLALLLAQQVGKPGRVFGVDFSACQLEIAQHRPRPFTIPTADITWVEADVLALPFADHTFDCATMGYGLRNVVDISRSLQELYRVLKPGATAAILDFHRPQGSLLRSFQLWYLEQFVVRAAEQLGFQDEYAYINPSLDKFPIGSEQVLLARQAGFFTATHYPIASGMMGVLVITKAN
ncbi:MAG TPA: bifunctional demethylmenaquinone methyltransferase/2-methoxy-6-polyprenyl-1,4-benzoquinol methylase UbiE [Planktothrix sp. UBA10369]|jgi:ubiquinone/menaquinone biosynthesis methyltransferases|nr:bifunctional demethylmenaquinone methyltransferase/2-methoxy-6-polyprenyl-1,4-benzoquinol methylase UbiE [Planktothrix sp. UBA8402]HBK23943.1 bifunctional demethylmenaquinone methyltransferase/2-methoxy-6-polyprenyl-1,4-benzoquinol methylase UbiE [Planktothrix sp. UBA10369]